jgi:hypothetical protein
LVEWLNGRKEAASKDRVIQLLRDIHSFYGLSELGESYTSFPSHPFTMARMLLAKGIRAEAPITKLSKRVRQTIREHSRLYRDINRRLSSYSFIPIFGQPTELGWLVDWLPITHPSLDFLPRAGQQKKSRVHVNESLAVLAIVELSKLGTVTRVRDCRQCGRWFFARFRHQKFCNASCQQTFYWKSDAGRASRRDYMRRYRRIKSLPGIK